MNNLIVKSFTTTKNGDNIKSITYLDDNGVEVTISSASMLHGSSKLQSNGTYNFDDGDYAGVKTVVVNVETQGTIKEKNYNVTLNQNAQDIQITSDITTSDNYDEEVNTGKVHIPDSRLTSKEADLSKSENVTVLPDHYGLSSVVVPPVDSRLILKDETLTGTQRRSNSCDMTSLVGQYGSEAGWVEVPIESNPNNQKYGYEAIFLPNTRLQYQYITRQEVKDWIESNDKLVINPDPGMFGLSSVVLPRIKSMFVLQDNKEVEVNNLPLVIDCENEDYAGAKKVTLSIGDNLLQSKTSELSFELTDEYNITNDNDYFALSNVNIKLNDLYKRKLIKYDVETLSIHYRNNVYTGHLLDLYIFDENFKFITYEEAKDCDTAFIFIHFYYQTNTDIIDVKKILYKYNDETADSRKYLMAGGATNDIASYTISDESHDNTLFIKFNDINNYQYDVRLINMSENTDYEQSDIEHLSLISLLSAILQTA